MLLVAHVIGVLVFLVTGGLPIPFDGAWAIHRNANAVFLRTLVADGPAGRSCRQALRNFLRGAPNSAARIFCDRRPVLAALLALGPRISAAGHLIGTGPVCLAGGVCAGV